MWCVNDPLVGWGGASLSNEVGAGEAKEQALIIISFLLNEVGHGPLPRFLTTQVKWCEEIENFSF